MGGVARESVCNALLKLYLCDIPTILCTYTLCAFLNLTLLICVAAPGMKSCFHSLRRTFRLLTPVLDAVHGILGLAELLQQSLYEASFPEGHAELVAAQREYCKSIRECATLLQSLISSVLVRNRNILLYALSTNVVPST